jgi:hypothetical protein
MFRIERGVPIPARRNPRGSMYPFAEMEIGDSFFVPDGTTKTISAAAQYFTKNLGRRFTVRTIDSGVRVWRID